MDNLPVALIPILAELYDEGGGEIERAALLVDAREGEQIEKLPDFLKQLRSEHPSTLVFIEASDDALMRRFSETRRPHPFGMDLSVREGIRDERRRMEPIRRLADVTIDTTKFNVHELRQFIIDRFQNPQQRPLLVSLVSFGSATAFPPMPIWYSTCVFCRIRTSFRDCANIPARTQGGRYIRSFPQTGEFLRRIKALLAYLIPHYIRKGKAT